MNAELDKKRRAEGTERPNNAPPQQGTPGGSLRDLDARKTGPIPVSPGSSQTGT